MRMKYPSVIKYEENHPPITFRMTKEEKEKITQLAAQSNRSVSELVRMALLGLEKDFKETWDDGYGEGYNDGERNGKIAGKAEGVTEGTKTWAIWMDCWRCKKPVYIVPNSPDHKKMIERGRSYYSHSPECPP
jgi:predicted transcriptional regulator